MGSIKSIFTLVLVIHLFSSFESNDRPFAATIDYSYQLTALTVNSDKLHNKNSGKLIAIKTVLTGNQPVRTDKDTTNPPWKKYINLETYSAPFWSTDTITDETVQVIRDSGLATSELLFRAKKILVVRAADYSREFVQGKDWDYKNGQLIFSPGSAVPFFYANELVFNKEIPGKSMVGKTPGTFVLFSEGSFFSSRQIAVTYIKDKGRSWQGPVPAFSGTTLPNTLAKLKNKEPLKIVFYGNSIEVGYNASGLEDAPPYMPVWPELIINKLESTYGHKIFFTNKSIAGKLAQWGADSVGSLIIPERPDLLIIGFGMNDGTMKVSPLLYREQIKAVIDSVTHHNPRSEFILVAPMLANPLTTFDGLQRSYKVELDKLKRKGVVVADLTGVHEELLKHKRYQDMTGNNINHPNDYLARWYAQFICGLLTR